MTVAPAGLRLARLARLREGMVESGCDALLVTSLSNVAYLTGLFASAAGMVFTRDHCALITDGRFSGATSGLSIGHVSPEAAAGGAIGLIEDGDTVEIDIPARRISLSVSEDVLVARRATMEARPKAERWRDSGPRTRKVTAALRAYAAFAASADKGGIRQV